MWNIDIISMIKCRKDTFVKFTASLSAKGNCQLKSLSLYCKIFQYNYDFIKSNCPIRTFVFVKCGIACLISICARG